MPRTFTANAQTKVDTELGTEPINIVEISFNNTTTIRYCDKDFQSAGIEGKILELSNLDEVLSIRGDTSSTISVTLDDTDGSIKNLLDNYNIHKRPCKIYQNFHGLTFADSTLLFSGIIVTPIEWSEQTRTVKFSVLSQIRSKEVGFSPEEGQFKSVQKRFLNQAWPLAFGDVVHVPAQQIQTTITGTSLNLFGYPDQTLSLKLKIINKRLDILNFAYNMYYDVIEQITDVTTPPKVIQEKYVELILKQDEVKAKREDLVSELEELNKDLAAQQKLYSGFVTLGDEEEIVKYGPIVQDLRWRRELQLAGVKSYTSELETLKLDKNILEIEAEYTQYAWDVVTKLRNKLTDIIEKAIVILRTKREYIRAIADQANLMRRQLIVFDGNKFPQNRTIDVIANGLILSGSFDGNLFDIQGLKPTYENIEIGPREDENVQSFWLVDDSINLAGMYCKLPDKNIIKVSSQEGLKCTIEVIKKYDNTEGKKPFNYKKNEVDDYREAIGQGIDRLLVGNETPEQILNIINQIPKDISPEIKFKLAGATEYTLGEIIKKIENRIADTEFGDAYKSIKNKIAVMTQKFEEYTASGELDQEMSDDYKAMISGEVDKYQHLIERIQLPFSILEEYFRNISDKEYKLIFNMEIMNFLYWRRSFEPMNPIFPNDEEHDPSLYYVAGQDIKSIVAASPIIPNDWLSDYDEGTDREIFEKILSLPANQPFIANVGTIIKLTGNYQEKYVCNILPSQIKSVYAYRILNGVKVFLPVPSRYYSKNQSESFGSLTCTTISLKRPLSDYLLENWESDLYVTLSSSVGPNTADILKWIIETYTDISVDNTSYLDVKDRLTNYPSHFCLFEKQDCLELVKDIAWQARCVLWVINGVAYMRYLSAEPTSVQTITESDVDQDGTISIFFSETEDLVTKFTALWQETYQFTEKVRTILRHNVGRYDEVKKDYDFFIYNMEDLVIKSATFWMIRNSNTWKKVRFKTFLTSLKIQTLDCITLNFGAAYIANTAVKAIVEKADYDSASNTIIIEAWTPVRSGEMVPYTFAWPADIDVNTIFPTVDDITTGNAGGDSTVPTGSSWEPNENGLLDDNLLEIRPKDFGSINPSDNADEIPDSPLTDFEEIDYKNIDIEDIAPGDQPKLLPSNKNVQTINRPPIDPSEQDTDNILAGYGVVQSRIEDEFETLDNLNQVYEVAIFENGKILNVRQMQIDPASQVPNGTVVMVVYSKNKNEYYMQAPVHAPESIDVVEAPVKDDEIPDDNIPPNAAIFSIASNEDLDNEDLTDEEKDAIKKSLKWKPKLIAPDRGEALQPITAVPFALTRGKIIRVIKVPKPDDANDFYYCYDVRVQAPTENWFDFKDTQRVERCFNGGGSEVFGVGAIVWFCKYAKVNYIVSRACSEI